MTNLILNMKDRVRILRELDLGGTADAVEAMLKRNELLEHEIDVQCSSEYVEKILKRNELLEKVIEHTEHLLAGGNAEATHHLKKALAELKENKT